jgi:peroxiredoxin
MPADRPAGAADDDGGAPKSPPAVGDEAPRFALKDLSGEEVALAALLKEGPVVLVVLRGYPGYQCPICNRQVGELLGKAKDFAAKKARVVFVYPGPAEDLDKYAREFVSGKEFPENFEFVIDPDYKFTAAYALRWDAPRETAYPSAFVIDSGGKVLLAKISKSHGGRASAAELLEAL